MPATYTFDVFSSLDGFGAAGGDWTGYWGRQEQSEVPLRSHGSLSTNRALVAAGLVDRVQVTLFPVITGRTGLDPVFQGAADFDLELIESRTPTAAFESSCTGPPCMTESVHAPGPVEQSARASLRESCAFRGAVFVAS